MRTFRGLWNFAQRRDPSLADLRNPVTILNEEKLWYPERQRRTRVAKDDLPAFYEAVDNFRNHRAPDEYVSRDAIKLLLFTGLRLREGILLTWDEVDLQARYIRLAAWRNKGRRFFDLPMPDIVHDMLVARRAIGHKSEHVFPVYRPRKSDGRIGPLNNINHVLYRIGDATGIEVHPHALRRTFQSVAATVGLGAYEQKALVNHAFPRGDVTGGYVEFEDDDLAQAMQRVADRMKELCKIDELNAANVTKLRGANPV